MSNETNRLLIYNLLLYPRPPPPHTNASRATAIARPLPATTAALFFLYTQGEAFQAQQVRSHTFFWRYRSPHLRACDRCRYVRFLFLVALTDFSLLLGGGGSSAMKVIHVRPV